MKKNLPLHDPLVHFVFLYISTVCLRRRLPYLIKDDHSEELQNSLTKKGLILDQWKITPLCCCFPFSTLLGFLAKKCCIVSCIVIANPIIVAQRRIWNHAKYLRYNFFEKRVKSQKLNCFLKILVITLH